MNNLERIRWTLSLALLVVLVVGLYTVIEPFLVPVTWSVVLVLSTWPLYRRLRRRLPRHPAGSALLMTALLALVLILAVGPLLTALGREFREAGATARRWIEGTGGDPAVFVAALPWISEELRSQIAASLAGVLPAREDLFALLAQYQGDLFRAFGLAARELFTALAGLLLCLVTSFFLYLHGAALGDQIVFGLRRVGGERFERLLFAMRATVKGSVYGIVATAMVQGILAGLGYVVAGAPVPVLLGFATMIFSLIPFGTPLVYLPAAAVTAFTGDSWIPGALLAAWGVGVVSMADNILRPLFISQATRMNVLLVFFGVIGGILQFGLLGIFIGPALIAIAHVLWLEWVQVDTATKAPER